MRGASRVVLLGVVAIAVAACSGPCGARPIAPGPTAAIPAAAAPVRSDDAALGERVVALLRELDGIRDSSDDFAAIARRFHAVRGAVTWLQGEGPDPERRRSLGIDALAIRYDEDLRAFLRQRVPPEMRGLIEAGAETAGRAVTLEEARNLFLRRGRSDELDALTRMCLPEADSAEFDRLIALGEGGCTEVEIEVLKRLATTRRTVREELALAWREGPRGEPKVASYGAGSVFLSQAGSTEVDARRTPEQWWTDATFEERTQWLIAWSAERAGRLNVLRVWDDVCGSCRPGGAEDAADPRCRACGGGGWIRRVRWR